MNTLTKLASQCAPVESEEARRAIVAGYKALMVLHEAGLVEHAIAPYDPKAASQVLNTIQEIETLMSPNLLITILPAYTKVAFTTKQSDRLIEGLIREDAWGLYPDARGETATQRRITTTGDHGGWEMSVDLDTEFTYFEILERGK